MNNPQEAVYTSPKESVLRGLYETPLRAVRIGGFTMTDDVYIMINTLLPYPGRYQFGYQFSNPNFYRNVISNMTPGVTVGGTNDIVSGIYEISGNYPGSDFGGDLLRWSGAPVINQWQVGFYDQNNIFNFRPWHPPSDIPDYLFNGNISGFACWPIKHQYTVPGPNSGPVDSSPVTHGACFTFGKQGIKGVVTFHNVVTPPTTFSDWGLISQPTASTPVDIPQDLPYGPYDIFNPPPNYYVVCPANKMMIFWIGLTASTLPIPSSGNFSPAGYGLLSSYSTINPPYP